MIWIGGLYPLIHPDASNLSNGNVRIKVLLETLSYEFEQVLLEQDDEIGEQHEEEQEEVLHSEPSIANNLQLPVIEKKPLPPIINYLNITIQEAIHLPSIMTSYSYAIILF